MAMDRRPFLGERSTEKSPLFSQNGRLSSDLSLEGAEHADGPRKFYKGEYTRMGVWLAVLTCLWIITRVTCACGAPNDCVSESSPSTTMNDIQILLLYGFTQAWFVEILERRRFWHVFSLQRWYFWVVLAGTPPVFSVISDLPVMEFSISSSFSLSGGMVAVLVAAGTGFSLWLAFHILYAKHVYAMDNFLVYVLGRVGVLLFFLVYMMVAYNEYEEYHFHHYWLAWAVSLFASFNHPASLLLLAVSTGVMVQGLGAYHTDFVFYADSRR
ncbi:unnamed protein product [Heterosigma akashiwo]